MGTKVGFKGTVVRNTGTWADPVWSKIDIARDITVPLTKGEVDVSDRSTIFKLMKSGMKELSFEFEVKLKRGDAGFNALRDAFLNDTAIELAVLTDDPDAGDVEGPRAVCEVFDFSPGKPLEGAQTVSVKAKPTEADNNPEWLEIAALSS